MLDFRLRSMISDEELGQKVGKVVTPADFNVMLTGPARATKPDGSPLCVYLPGFIPEAQADAAYPVLHSVRNATTENRGMASGTARVRRGTRNRSDSKKVASMIMGAFEATGNYKYCRLTAWTGEHARQFPEVFPVLETVAQAMAAYVPDRYRVQAERAARTHPAWRIGDTPFTTLTVNNTYPTGVHLDDGDLEGGFSSIFCLRRGDYQGGYLVFPRYRVAVDLGDRDLILMDAHEWHGNTAIQPGSGDAERISVVSYYRTNMARCGPPEHEEARAHARAERRNTARTNAGSA
jgi:hypothetical protein